MEKIVGTLSEHTKKICLRRQELEKDEELLKRIVDNLTAHCCTLKCDQTTGWSEKEEILKAYQKAREERDEYKFQLNVCKNKIKELKEELGATKLNQTQHNISVVADLSHSEQKSYSYPDKLGPGDEKILERELQYLHKTNHEFLAKIRKLESNLSSHDQLLAKSKKYEEEIAILRKTIEEKNAKIMHMRVEFDEQHKNSKRDFTYQISGLNTRIEELEALRDSQKIDLEEAHEEIRLLKLSFQKPVKEAAGHSVSIEFPDKAFTNSEQKEKKTLNEKEMPFNVNTQREKRGKLQPIENITEHQNSSYTILSERLPSEEQQVTVEEVKDLCPGVTRGSRRNAKGNKEKEAPVSQKQETKKTTRRRAAVNPKRKPKACSNDDAVTSNKENKKLMAEIETDENVEPCSFGSRSHSFIGDSGSIRLAEDTSTPMRKPLKKVQGDGKRKRRK